MKTWKSWNQSVMVLCLACGVAAAQDQDTNERSGAVELAAGAEKGAEVGGAESADEGGVANGAEKSAAATGATPVSPAAVSPAAASPSAVSPKAGKPGAASSGLTASKIDKADKKDSKGFPVKISGFVSATIYAQDRAFTPGNGQGAWFPVVGPKGSDPWMFDGDVRNTRLQVIYDGPTLTGIKLGSLIEADFFGGFVPSLLTGDEQPIPRLRLAYAEVKFWRLRVRVGQAWSPLFGNTPKSLAHLAFPLGFGSGGKLGWRYPGIYTTLTLTDPKSPVQAKAELAVMRGSWGDMAGQAGIPQFEACVRLANGAGSRLKWSTYLAGHYDQKDLSGPGSTTSDDQLHSYAGQFGASLTAFGALLHGNIYLGRAIGQQFGQLLQLGDIAGWGAWVQVGYNITDALTVLAFYGVSNPDDEDIFRELLQKDGNWVADATARKRNQQVAVAVHYAIGPLTLGAEYFRADLDHVTVDSDGNPPTAADHGHTGGQQISFNTLFKF